MWSFEIVLSGRGLYTRRYTKAHVKLPCRSQLFEIHAGTKRRAGKAEMNLIQRGTTASRANRGKSVKKSIARRCGTARYDRNGVVVSLIPTTFRCRLL